MKYYSVIKKMKSKDLNIKTNLSSPLGVRGILMLLLFCAQIAFAQSPKREMRATWLTTVWRLDWPSVTVPNATGSNGAARQSAIQQQKNDLIKILDGLKAANMNAAFFQIRSMCDAMYKSSYEPWSSFISSDRGADPGYDPLAFAIEESHKRGIELHAWINPFRYSTSSATHGELASDYYNTHRDWLMASDSYTKILNPGIPEVVQQITNIVKEVVTNYDVDGIVFDDYFYINGGTRDDMDQAQFDAYNPNKLSRGDWRRENVNKMVKSVYDAIQSVDPSVVFGISPAGVAASSVAVAQKYGVPPAPVGSDWQYNGIFSDPLAWLQQGTIDYISPQIYWTIGSGNDYSKLCTWWSYIGSKFAKHFYSSHDISGLTASQAAPTINKIIFNDEEVAANGFSMIELSAISRKNESEAMRAPQATNFLQNEVGQQVILNRENDANNAPGSVFYATARLINTSGFINYLKTNIFTQPSLRPSIGWKRAEDQTLVDNITINNQTLTWTYNSTNVNYAVYAVPNANRNEVGVFAGSKYLLGMAFEKQYILPAAINSSTHKIAVSIIDNYSNEFSARVLGENTSAGSAANLIFPAADANTLMPCVFTWEAVDGADSYIWQVSRDAQFTDLICSRETTQPQFFSGLQTNLNDKTDYYWRVRTRKANTIDTWSNSRKFKTKIFAIVSPQNSASAVSLTPTISWDYVSATASYTIEIATTADFVANKQVFKQTLTSSSITIPAGTLISSTNYYLRILVSDGIVKATSETVMFTTLDLVIPVPQLTKPTDGSKVKGTSIEVCWAPQVSNGFRIELSKDASFPSRATTVKNVDSNSYCGTYDGLAPATYYVRVKAISSKDVTEPSNTVSVVLSDETALSEISLADLKCFIRSNGAENSQLIINSNESFEATIFLSSLTGSLQLSKKMSILSGENTLLLNNGGVSKGVYILTIKSKDKAISYKIIN